MLTLFCNQKQLVYDNMMVVSVKAAMATSHAAARPLCSLCRAEAAFGAPAALPGGGFGGLGGGGGCGAKSPDPTTSLYSPVLPALPATSTAYSAKVYVPSASVTAIGDVMTWNAVEAPAAAAMECCPAGDCPAAEALEASEEAFSALAPAAAIAKGSDKPLMAASCRAVGPLDALLAMAVGAAFGGCTSDGAAS